MINKKGKSTVSQILYSIIFILLFPVVILFLAGDWFWIEGWIFSIWFLVMCLSIGINDLLLLNYQGIEDSLQRLGSTSTVPP